MAQLLDTAFGVFNNRDQAEGKRTQCETRQAKQQAQIMAIAITTALQPQGHPVGNKECSKGATLQPQGGLF